MKILTIHADFIEFEAKKKAFKGAEEGIDKEKKRVEECLVIFTAVEKRDEDNPPAVINRYVQEIKNIALQVNAANLVLYPYAHLSSALSKPKIAEQVMKDAENLLTGKFKVTRAPFGWYKSFQISCKGHPLSELSREFSSEQKESEKITSLQREYKDEPFSFSAQELSREEKTNYSAAFILAKAIKDLFPQAKIGPLGFHYEQACVDISDAKLHLEDFPRIEKQMEKIIRANLAFENSSREEIRESWQREIINDIGQEKPVYRLETLSLVPLFKSPFLNSTQQVSAFKITGLGSAYWKGNEKNPQLARLYCRGFASKEKLQEYLKKQEEAENRSHLKIGKEQGLFLLSEQVGQGLPLLAPKGTIIRNEILNYLWELHKDRGYQQVWTPHIAKDTLYKTSGHWDKFGDELFKVRGKNEDFILKPMNCPHHMQIFDHFSFSYRDLPVRFFEPATVYRDEKSGQLSGLVRVRAITQDDGHLFCRVSQIRQEVGSIVSIIRQFYKTMGLVDYWVRLSLRGEDHSKYLGTDEVWKVAEDALDKAARENKLNYKRVEGEAAFYGPKLDFLFKDALGREWQLATIQCDFNLPERFDLSYVNEESKKERPVVIHRAISGALERFMSVLIEHFAGKFPLWLSPVQVKLVTVTDRSLSFAREIEKKMRQMKIRVELDDRSESLGKKVRDAQIEKVNYIVTIGDKEVEKNNLAVRDRKGDTRFDVEIEKFISELLKEIEERRIG